MPVVNVHRAWSKDAGSRSTDGTRVVDSYTVLVDDPTDTQFSVMGAAGLPQYGQAHPDDPYMRVASLNPRRVGPHLWEVLVNYLSLSIDPDDANPLLEVATREWRGAGSVEPVERDADANEVTNSSQEPFDPALTKEVDDLVLIIERNQAVFDPRLVINYYNVVNSDYFFVPAGQALIKPITARQVGDPSVENGFLYWRVRFEIHFRRDPDLLLAGGSTPDQIGPGGGSSRGGASKAWWRRVLDAGTRERVGTRDQLDADGQPVLDPDTNQPVQVPDYRPITGGNGEQITTPVLLDGAGRMLADGADPVYLLFRWFPSRAFGPLNLLGQPPYGVSG